MNTVSTQNRRKETLRGVSRTGLAVTAAVAALSLAATLTGCSNSALTKDFGVGQPNSSVRTSGSVYGGQQPITGATIQLYGVSTSLKGASTPLIGSTVTTSDGSGTGGNAGNGNNTFAPGSFSITGTYNCTGVSDVYIVASGGNPGAGVNSTVNMVAALGDCATLLANANNVFINMNEISTVAAAYALAPFSADVTHIGSPNATALTNAFNTVNELFYLAGGTAGGPALPPGGTFPLAELNTLGNILAACVNTAGSGSSQCTTLYSATGATDTFGAALAIANNSGSATITGLYALPNGTAPFQPSIMTQPNDFSVAVTYNAGGALAAPFGIAIDATGNAWVTNEAGNSVTRFSPDGAVLANATTAGLYGAQGVAVDRTGNVWVANTAGNSVVEFNATGGTVLGNFTAGGITAPTSIALDSAGSAFVSNFNGNSVTKLTSAGAAASGSPYTAGGTITVPSGLTLDASGNVLVTSGNGTVVKFSNTLTTPTTLTDSATQGPLAVAVDAAGNIFATGSTTGTSITGAVAEFTSAGGVSSASPVSTGTTTPFGIASDGTSVWVANSVTGGSLARFVFGSATPASPTAGFGSLNTPTGVAIDASGNVWTTNQGSNTVSKFVGLANPVTTPLAANVGP